jgi:hypothetical protein
MGFLKKIIKEGKRAGNKVAKATGTYGLDRSELAGAAMLGPASFAIGAINKAAGGGDLGDLGNRAARYAGLYGNDRTQLLKKGAITGAALLGGAGLAGLGPLAGTLGGVGSSIGGMFGGAGAAGGAGSVAGGGMSFGKIAGLGGKALKIGSAAKGIMGALGGGGSMADTEAGFEHSVNGGGSGGGGWLQKGIDWIGGALGGDKAGGVSGVLQDVAGQYLGNKLGENGIYLNGQQGGGGSGKLDDMFQLQTAAMDRNYAQQIENNNLRHQMAMAQLQKPMIPVNDPVADMQRYFGGNPMAQDVGSLMANYGRTQQR